MMSELSLKNIYFTQVVSYTVKNCVNPKVDAEKINLKENKHLKAVEV